MENPIEFPDAPEAVQPICPHCKTSLTTVWKKVVLAGFLSRRELFICPHCRALLAVAALPVG